VISRRRSLLSANRIHAGHNEAVRGADRGRRLPPKLLLGPGSYTVFGYSFVLDEPGFYRFEDRAGALEQRLVCGGSIEELLSDLTWIWAYGTGDDHLSARGRLRTALHRRVSVTCTPLSTDLAGILTSAGFVARPVLVFSKERLTMDDNGHTLLEVRVGGQWVLYDPSFRTFFRRCNRRLSLPEWCASIADSDYRIERLPAGPLTLGSFTPESADLQKRMETLTASEGARRQWYRHVAGVPLVLIGKTFVFAADDPLSDRLMGYSKCYQPMDPVEFRALWGLSG
jgi:hypothetical protein